MKSSPMQIARREQALKSSPLQTARRVQALLHAGRAGNSAAASASGGAAAFAPEKKVARISCFDLSLFVRF